MSTRQSPKSFIPKLTLFVTGTAPRSQRARANLARMLEQLEKNDIEALEVDLIKQPEAGLSHSIFATPALLKTSNDGTVSMLYGDLTNEERLYQFLLEL